MCDNIQSKVFGRKSGDWVWCLHCERCYKVGEYKMGLSDGLEYCPYDDCDGDTLLDSWSWEKIREGHPEYPEIPERVKVYLMY